jgi:pimeloyl-ACP methyl ester carboxylesterase
MSTNNISTSVEHNANALVQMKSNQLLETKTIKLSKIQTDVRIAELGNSSKPTIILLHGVPENLQCWYAVAPKLADNYHVLALDWPGFGGSEPLSLKQNYNSQFFAEVIVDFMDTLNVEKANLVATDISLLPSLLVGLEYPDRVLKLAVMDGIPFPRPQYASWELRSFAKKGSILGKALVNWFPGISSKIARLKGFYRGHAIPKEIQQEFASDGNNVSNQTAFLSYFQNFHIGQTYFEQQVKNMHSDVLVIWGKQDRFINKKLGVEIAEKLPNAKLIIVDKAGHYVHMDKPIELASIVTDFID